METDRLILRSWKYEDRESFAEMNGNGHVMKYWLSPDADTVGANSNYRRSIPLSQVPEAVPFAALCGCRNRR